jgi:hypothetical protein
MPSVASIVSNVQKTSGLRPQAPPGRAYTNRLCPYPLAERDSWRSVRRNGAAFLGSKVTMEKRARPADSDGTAYVRPGSRSQAKSQCRTSGLATAPPPPSCERSAEFRSQQCWIVLRRRPHADVDSPGRHATFYFLSNPREEALRRSDPPASTKSAPTGNRGISSLLALPEADGNRHDLSECQWRNLDPSLGISQRSRPSMPPKHAQGPRNPGEPAAKRCADSHSCGQHSPVTNASARAYRPEPYSPRREPPGRRSPTGRGRARKTDRSWYRVQTQGVTDRSSWDPFPLARIC